MRQFLSRLILPLIFSILFIIIHGYGYGIWEQTFYIPIMKRLFHPEYLKNDWFLNLPPYHTFFLWIWGWLSEQTSYPLATTGLYLACLILFFSALQELGDMLLKNKTKVAMLLLMTLLINAHGLGGYRIIHHVLVPALPAIILCLWSLLFILRKNFIAAILLTLVAGKIHLLIGLNWAIFVAACAFYNKNWRSFGILIITSIAAWAPELLANLSSAQETGNAFIAINTRFRYPQHYLLLYNGIGSLLLFLFMAWHNEKTNIPELQLLNRLLCIGCFINFLFVDIYPIAFIAKLQFLRLTFFYELIFILSIMTHYSKEKLLLPLTILAITLCFTPANYPLIIILLGFLFFEKHNTQQKTIPAIILSIALVLLVSVKVHQTPEPQSAWRNYCQRIKENTPADQIFMIDPHQEGFRLYAERAVYVDWRACPYREKDIIEWKKRYDRALNTTINSRP